MSVVRFRSRSLPDLQILRTQAVSSATRIPVVDSIPLYRRPNDQVVLVGGTSEQPALSVDANPIGPLSAQKLTFVTDADRSHQLPTSSADISAKPSRGSLIDQSRASLAGNLSAYIGSDVVPDNPPLLRSK